MAIPGPAENRIVTKPGDETAGSDATRAFIPPTPAPSGGFPFTGAPPAAGAPPLDPAEGMRSPRAPRSDVIAIGCHNGGNIQPGAGTIKAGIAP